MITITAKTIPCDYGGHPPLRTFEILISGQRPGQAQSITVTEVELRMLRGALENVVQCPFLEKVAIEY